MKISSSVFKESQAIPLRHAGEGENVSPPLEWFDVPAQSKSLVLIFEDLDAKDKQAEDLPFVHWLAYNISPSISFLSEGLAKQSEIHVPLRVDQGRNSFGLIGYDGPFPPEGENHTYVMNLFALDIETLALPGATQEVVRSAMTGHILQKTQLSGSFERVAPLNAEAI